MECSGAKDSTKESLEGYLLSFPAWGLGRDRSPGRVIWSQDRGPGFGSKHQQLTCHSEHSTLKQVESPKH